MSDQALNLVTPVQILQACCDVVGVHPDLVRIRRNRNPLLTNTRGCYVVVARTLLHASYPDLARVVNRTHSSLIGSCNQWRYWQAKGKPVLTRHGDIDRQDAIERVIAALRSHPGIYVPEHLLNLAASAGRYWSVGNAPTRAADRKAVPQ